MMVSKHSPHSRRRTAFKAALLLLVVVAALSVTGLATAQSSTSYEFGCWGITTAGGGMRSSTNYRLFDATGQTAVGQSASPSYQIRTGYIQPGLVAPSLAATGLNAPAQGEQNPGIYLPFLSNYIRIVYRCPY